MQLRQNLQNLQKFQTMKVNIYEDSLIHENVCQIIKYFILEVIYILFMIFQQLWWKTEECVVY